MNAKTIVNSDVSASPDAFQFSLLSMPKKTYPSM